MKSLSISGGSTKIAMLAGSAITVLKKYKYNPDIIVGTSAGGILSVPLALGLYDEIEELVLNFSLKDVFNKPPVSEKGNITLNSIIRVLKGEESLGEQDNLTKTLKKVITEQKFDQYQIGNYPNCYVGVVDYVTGKKRYINLKTVSYNDYFKYVKATSSIPVFVESVKIEDNYYFDGGVRDHIGSYWAMENFPLKENISIYSRPEDYNITEPNWYPKNILTVLQRTLDIMSVEISKEDEWKEDELSKTKSIKNTKIFTPYRLTNNIYETDKKLLKAWYELGVEQVEKTLGK